MAAFYSLLESTPLLPGLMQNITLALLTILIPVAIAILGDLMVKRRDQRIDFAELDLHVILDYVFRFKLLLVYVLISFSPLFFWDHSTPTGRMIIVAVWLFGTWCLIKTLLDIYLWVKGNIFDFRVAYLRQLTDPKDLAIVWRSVWSARNIPAAEERRLFEVFAATVGDLVEDGDAQE